MNFMGRKKELELLSKLKQKKSASLVVLRGRRRIGKSRLIKEFGGQFKNYFEIQGLGPKDGTTLKTQLDYFANELSIRFNARKENFQDWTEALHALARHCEKGEWLILLDEISWLAKGDPFFAEKIKSIWDSKFKNNPHLILVLCGSVSSWIEEEIVKNKVFEGRISLDLTLQELNLLEIQKFWDQQKIKMGTFEKIMILSVTGGVPKYLEEVLTKESAEQNLMRLCFLQSGFLYNEFEKIFKEIFQKKSTLMEKIVRELLISKKTPSSLAASLDLPLNQEFSENIRILELSGFITKDTTFHYDGSPSKFNYLRLKDNYLRFYLKFIEPLKARIQSGGKKITRWSDLNNPYGILGLQFENLLLANRDLIYKFLKLEDRDIVVASPYVQRKTSKIKNGCQIDLLIQTQLDVFYLCEFKCKKQIDSDIINEVKKKMDALKLPKRSSLKSVLIYEGETSPNTKELLEEFFYKTISFSELLENNS